MANKLRGEIPVEFRGERIPLVLSANSICALEAADPEGRTINEIVEEIAEGNPRFLTVRRVFWAMMLKARPEATETDAGELIDSLQGNHGSLMMDAVASAFPAPSGDAPGKDLAPGGTG